MADLYADFQGGLDAPASNVFAITPNNSTDLATTTRAISVGTSGYVNVTAINGGTAAIYVVAGIPFPVRAQRVWSSNTTATNIVGLV